MSNAWNHKQWLDLQVLRQETFYRPGSAGEKPGWYRWNGNSLEFLGKRKCK